MNISESTLERLA